MSNLFDIVNVNFGISTAEQPDEKIQKKVTLSYGQVSAPQVTSGSGSAVSVNHVVVCCPDKSDSSVAVTRNESEQVIEIDTLKQFTIPKKRKAKKELLESIRLDSREFQHDVLPVIQQSFKCHNARNNFTFLQARLVHNTQLFSQFVERRKQMRLEGYSDKDAQDSYAFLCVESEAQARKICKHGLYVGHSSLTCLGNPQMGLYLSRHADIVRACPFHPGFSAILIIFKIIKGKLKLMAESASNVTLDPTPNYDCHMSKAVTGDVFSMTPQQAFEATQMYLYEYGDLDLEERPRQICPYAMVHFCHSGEQQVYRRPTLPSQHASKPSSQRAAPAQKSPQSAGLQRPPYLQRQQSAPQHTPQHTQVSPAGVPSDPAMPVLTAESERGDGVAPTEPRRMSEGGTPMEPRRVGEEADGGVIVWEGEVTTRGCVLCNAELVSYSSGVKPARIGQELPLDCGQPLVKVKDKYFGHMMTLDKQEVVTVDNKYYSYCELHPTRTTQGKFNQIMTFLAKRQIGIIIKLPDNVQMVMLTNSEITQSLGLSEAHSNPLLLHCVFISPASRYTQLQGKLGSQPQHTDEVPRLNPPAQIHDKEPSNQNRFTSRSIPNLLHESRLDEDFRKFVPLSSLVYRNSLSIDFEIQANVQDQHNINIARGIITPNRQPGQGVPPFVTAVERGFGMDKHPSMPQSSPTSSHSMPELVGSIHCHQLPSAQPSRAPMPRHHSHSFDQSPIDIEPEFAACRSQCSDPTMAYGQSSMAYGRPQVNLSYGATIQHHHHSSQGYDDQHGAAHVLLSPPVPQPQPQQHPQQHPHWPSTQTLTYPQTSYARPVSTPIHTPPNIPRQVSDPRLLRNRRPSADVMQSAPVTSTAMFGAAGANAAMATTIQNQNLAECLSVGPSPTTGTSVQRHLVSTSPLSTGQSTGRICGTASMAEPPTERHITGDDKHVDTALRTGSPDGVAAGASASRSDVVAAVGSSTDVRTASAPTPVELFTPPSGRQSSYNTSSMDVDEMSDDLVDQIVRGCVMAARLKPSVTSSTDSYPASASLDTHPATTVAPPVDSITSQQLSKTSHKILEEMAKIKMLQEVKAAAEKLSQNAAAAATIPTASPATSTVPFPPFAFVSAAMPTGQAVPPLVAAHTTNTTTIETTTLIQTPQKSESGTHQQHRVSKQTVTVKKPHVGTKEKAKEKETSSKRKKSTSVIRTANDMKLFLNANKGHKRDGRVTKRTVTQKKTDPRVAKRAGVKKSRMEHRKQTPLSNISQTAQSPHRDFPKSLEAETKSLTHSPKKSKPSLVGHNAAHLNSHVSDIVALLTNTHCNNVVLSPQLGVVSKPRQSDPPGSQPCAGRPKAGCTVTGDSMTNVANQTLAAGNTSHRNSPASGSINFPDTIGQTKEFHLSQSCCLKVSIQNDTRPPEGGTGAGKIGDETIESTDLAGESDTEDVNACDIVGIASPPHEIVTAFEIPEIPTASFIGSAGNIPHPPLTQLLTDAVRQKAVSFLKDITPQLFSPILAAKGLDPFNRVLFEGATVYVGNAIDDITVTFTRDSGDLAEELGDKLEKDEMLEQCLFEAMHRYESDESEPETEAEMEMTDLWHISLHYLLPIIDWLQLHDREVMEDEGREEGKENTAPSPESSQRPETSTATAASAEATAAVTATTAATMEASVFSPSVTSSTAVTTPMAMVIMPTLPARHNQVMPSVSKCPVSSPGAPCGAAVAESVCVCGGQSDTATSVSVSVVHCPLSPLSVLSTCSSDVCLVAVEITPAKPRPSPASDSAENVASEDAVLVKQENFPAGESASEDHSNDECYIVDDITTAITSSCSNSPEIVIVESDFFVDSHPIRQIQPEKARDVSDTVLSSPSDSDLELLQRDFEADVLPSGSHLIPLLLLDAVSDASDTAMSASPTSSRSKQLSHSKATKRKQPVEPEACWMKVGHRFAPPIVISPSTQSLDVSSSRDVSIELTVGGASKRRIIEVTPTGEGSGQPLKKACLDKALTMTVGDGRGPTSSDVPSSGARSVVLVPQETVTLGENTAMASSPQATRRLQKKARSFESPRSNASNYTDTDLRSVIVNLRNEKVTKTGQRRIGGKNRMEGDSWKVPGDGKTRTASRRGRSDSESSSRGGVEDRGGDRKDGGDVRNRLQNKNSRWDSESASRYSNGSRYTGRTKVGRVSSTRRGQDVRSRLTVVDTEDSHSQGGSHKSAAAGGKSTTSSGVSTSDRFHPYRRPSRQSLAIKERLASYSDARDLEELMSCLTSPCYRGRRKQLVRFAPLLDLFARPQLFSAGRFDTYNYCPNMLDTSRDVAATDDREVEMRDVPYKAEEIPDYNERKVKANILDEHISSSVPCNDQQVAALNTEQQFYPYELAGNTVEVQSGKLGGITDGPVATTCTTMANVAHARRSTPPTRLVHCCGKSDRKTWKRVGVETMVKSQESSEASEMFGGGRTPWPGLKTEVDVCLSASRHRRNPCQVDLPQLIDAQVVMSRDPRLSANLCSSSIYLRTCSVDKSCDSSKDSFTSEDWSCKDNRERVELVTEAKMIKVKVLVNPKYIADTCKIDLFDSVQKIVCSKDMCSGGRKVTTDTANDSSKQKNATANGHRDCNSKTKPIEAAKITTEFDPRKNQQQHPTAASLRKCGKDTQQTVSSDGKQHTPTVKHLDKQKKHHSKSDVKTSNHKDTSGKKIHRNKQLEHKLDAAEFGSDANPNGGRSCHKCPVINSDKEPGHISELPTRTLRQQRTAQQDHSKKQSTDPDESEGGSKGHSNKTLLPKGKKMPVSQCTVNSQEISVQIDHAMDKDLVSTKKVCQKICVKPHLDKQLPCSNDNEDVCRANSEQQVHSVGNRPSSPENIRSIKTSCDARVQHERAMCERGAEHSRCKRQHPPVPLSTPGDSNISGYTRNKTTKEASVMSEDYRSVVIKRRSGFHVKKRQRAKVSVDDDKTDQQVRLSSREASRELSPPAVDWHATNCVDQRTDRENTTVRRCDRWHATVEHLNPLSGFVEDCLYKQCNYSQQRWTSNIMKFQLRKVLNDMERVYQGKDVCSVRVLTPIKHLSVLSLPTELEASYIESPFVRTLHLQALREWMAKKPLDMLLLGKGQPLRQPLWSLPATSQTDDTVTGCSVEFFGDMFHLLCGGRCGSDDVQDLYPEPCSATQETVHQVFRQVRHYMEFLAKKQSSGDRQASQKKSRLVSCQTNKSTHHRTDEGRTDVHGSGDGTEGIWEIPLEPEYEYIQHDPRKRGERLKLKSIDDNINGMLDEFYGDVDELLDANCLSNLSQQRSRQKLIANRLPKSPHITKHLMNKLMAMNRDKRSAASSCANEKPVNGALENDTADAGKDSVLYSPTQPTGFDDSGLIQPDVESKAKMTKRKTKACTDNNKCKKRRTKTTSSEDTHVRVDRRSITGNKRRYSDVLSEEIIHLNMEENTLPIEQKQNATSDAHGKADSFIAPRKCADESRRKTTDFVTACRMSCVKNETHNSQMRRFRRQLQSRRTCFLDSYLSSSGDALGYTPVSNFDSSFDQTCSPHEANCNPYVLTGPMLQYFLEPHETRLTSHIGKFCPSPTQFTSSKLEPENSFMWSLALNNVKPKIESPEKPSVVSEDAPNDNRHEPAVEVCNIREPTIEDHDSIEPTVEDRDSHDPEVEDCDYHESAVGNDDSHEPTMEDHDSHDQTVENHDRHELAVEGQTQTENFTDLAATLLAYHGASPSKKLAPIKQGNRLMQAFRQAVEAKKRAKTNTKAAARVLMKLDPEKRPYPKAAVTLFKPPIAFTLMQKSRIATMRAEVVTANIEHAAPTKEKDENRFVVTLPELSKINSVTQESFSSISLQLEDALTEDFGSPAVNGIVHQEPDILQHGLTVRHLSSLSVTTKRIYRTNRSRVSRFSSPVTETAASQPTSGEETADGNVLSTIYTSPVSSQQPDSLTAPYSVHTPMPSPVYSFALKKKLKCDTPRKESTVALSFDMVEDHDKCSDEPEPTDEETVSKRSMYPRETIAFDEDSSSRAALMRLQKLGRSSGTGTLGDIPTPTGKVTSDCNERSQNECQQRTNAVIQPSIVSLNNAAAHLLDTLQAVKEDMSEPTLSRPVDEIRRAEEQPTNAYGSPVTHSESGDDHRGTGEKLTPTRNKLLQAFRQAVAAKNKLSPDSPMKALAKEQPTPQPDSVTTGEPAKKKVIFEISGMASRNGGSIVNGAPEVKREDEASRQPPKDALSGGDVIGVDCGDVSQKRKTDACESDDGGSDNNDALTECVVNAIVVSQWPLPEAEMDTSEPSTSCAANDQAINKLPSATHHNIGTIPLPSFVGQPTDVLNALTLSQGPSIVPSLPPISSVAPSLPQGHSIAPSLPPISSVAPSLHHCLSIAPSLPPVPSVASSLPPVHSIAPSLPPVPSIALSLSLVPSIAPSLSLVPSITPSFSPVPSIASSLPVDPSTVPPLPAPPLPPFHTLGSPPYLSTATPLPHDPTNAPPLPPDPITPPPPDPSTAPPLPPPPDPSTASPPPVVPSPTDETAKMPWMTGEPSALDQLHLQAMSAFLQHGGATVGTDTPQGETDTSAYTDLQYLPYDIAATDQYAYWCQYYYHVNPCMWGWGQWGGYWSHWQQQQQLMGGYPSAWTTPPYPQQWTQPQPTYPGQTTGSTRRFLLPTPDTSQPPPWGNTSSYPPTGVPPPGAPALQGGDAEKVHAIDIRSPVLVNKTRMYVLNRDRLVCKSIERFLLFMGAKSLDPFNLHLLPPSPAEVFVLIHKADAHQLHQIPNLLRLKEEEHIQFVIYQDVMDVKHRLYIPILSRGGMLVADDMALFSVNPETLLHLVEYLEKQTDDGNPWCLKVHAHMLQQIEKAKLKHHTTSHAYRRLGEVTRILTTHVTVVDILPEHATCIRPHPARLYFNCCRTLQHQQADTYRHTILLSESTWSDVDVKAFQSSGISVTSIVDFVKRVTGKTVEPQAVVQRPDFGLRESPLFSDFCQSSAVDTIETLITSTEDVDGHAEDTSEGNDCEQPQRESTESTEAVGSFLHSFVHIADRCVAGTE